MTRPLLENVPGRRDGRRVGRPSLWNTPETVVLANWPDGGGYPSDFLEWANRTLGVTDSSRVLHMCSGGVKTGITVDIRPELEPTIVADARAIPLPDASVEWIMADPPYTSLFHRELYSGSPDSFPRPSALLREAGRLLVPGGRFGILHYMVPMPIRPLSFVRTYGVSYGFNFTIRAWSVYRKDDADLGLVRAASEDQAFGGNL